MLEKQSDNFTKIELANFCVNESLEIMKHHFFLQNKDTITIVDEINGSLEKANKICQDITHRDTGKTDQIELSKGKRPVSLFLE